MPGTRRALRPLELILSCEHGGNRVPARYRGVCSETLLATHRGYDPGALTVASDFAAATGARLFYSTISRLLVELNRPLGHHHILSARALRLPAAPREELPQPSRRPSGNPGDGAGGRPRGPRRPVRALARCSFAARR